MQLLLMHCDHEINELAEGICDYKRMGRQQSHYSIVYLTINYHCQVGYVVAQVYPTVKSSERC